MNAQNEFDYKSQISNDFRPKLLTTRSSIATYYSYFEIAELSQYRYFIDLEADQLKRGNEKAFTFHFVVEKEIKRKQSDLKQK